MRFLFPLLLLLGLISCNQPQLNKAPTSDGLFKISHETINKRLLPPLDQAIQSAKGIEQNLGSCSSETNLKKAQADFKKLVLAYHQAEPSLFSVSDHKDDVSAFKLNSWPETLQMLSVEILQALGPSSCHNQEKNCTYQFESSLQTSLNVLDFFLFDSNIGPFNDDPKPPVLKEWLALPREQRAKDRCSIAKEITRTLLTQLLEAKKQTLQIPGLEPQKNKNAVSLTVNKLNRKLINQLILTLRDVYSNKLSLALGLHKGLCYRDLSDDEDVPLPDQPSAQENYNNCSHKTEYSFSKLSALTLKQSILSLSEALTGDTFNKNGQLVTEGYGIFDYLKSQGHEKATVANDGEFIIHNLLGALSRLPQNKSLQQLAQEADTKLRDLGFEWKKAKKRPLHPLYEVHFQLHELKHFIEIDLLTVLDFDRPAEQYGGETD